jgi:tripartite-type tricarboxylate transporter receptor subunit TctC
MFKLQNGVQATHIPYVQISQAIGDLISGINQYMFITTLPVVDLINAGKLNALAVTAPKRIAALPNVPTVAEQGFPNLVVEDWVGLAVKNGTPPEIVARLNQAINKALSKPNVRDAFAKIGAEPAGGSAEDFGALLKQQVSHWQQVVTGAKIKM